MRNPHKALRRQWLTALSHSPHLQRFAIYLFIESKMACFWIAAEMRLGVSVSQGTQVLFECQRWVPCRQRVAVRPSGPLSEGLQGPETTERRIPFHGSSPGIRLYRPTGVTVLGSEHPLWARNIVETAKEGCRRRRNCNLGHSTLPNLRF